MNREQRLNIFLPVYNRAAVSKAFLAHLRHQIPRSVDVRLWVLDDGSRDNTVEAIAQAWPPYAVIQLGGKAYWGGALNAIRKLVISHQIHFPELVMVCNDDIRFVPRGLALALAALEPGRVMFASSQLVEFEPTCSSVPTIQKNTITQAFCFFDHQSCKLRPTSDPAQANVASTYALIAHPKAWIDAGPIPSAIPHYLSDYWLTYKMHLSGHQLIQPDGFHVFVSANHTKNPDHPANLQPAAMTSRLQRLFRPLKRRLQYYARLADPISPGYPLAWLAFKSVHTAHPISASAMAKIHLRMAIGSFLRQLGVR